MGPSDVEIMERERSRDCAREYEKLYIDSEGMARRGFLQIRSCFDFFFWLESMAAAYTGECETSNARDGLFF